MKTNKKILVLLCSIFTLSNPLTVFASSDDNSIISIEYLTDGNYIETKIESFGNARSTIKNASKTVTYKNEDGDSLWYAKVTANFYFDGKTSSCTSSSASAGTYVDGWEILSKSSSRTGNTGSATVTAGCYMAGFLIKRVPITVTLSCDKNGNLS